MKTAILALATGVLALSGISNAHADTFSPSSSTTVFTGPVALSGGGLVLTCTMTATVVANAAGTDAQVTAAGLGGGLCTVFAISNLPWNIDVSMPTAPPAGVTATQLKVTNVQVAPCGPGDLTASWSAIGPSIIFPTGTVLMPGSCFIRGTLTQSSGPSLAITN